MKKNKMMRLASCLLVMVLLTTSMISGTFAKYTADAESFDQARVAQWGFGTEKLDITNLFSNAYDANATDKTVNSKVDVIAPGTAGSADFTFAYKAADVAAPEVAYSFVVSTEGSACDASIINNSNIQWKLDEGPWGTWSQLIASIEALDGDENFAPGELPAASSAHTVSWQWLFPTSADATADARDTEMGNAVELANVKLVIKITATQID